jgi:hypothetical protein
VGVKSDTIKVKSRIIDMFLPNTDSFVLIRRSIVKPSFPVFLPNKDSFLLIRRPVVKLEFTPTPVSSKTGVGATISQSTDSEQSEVNDQGKRNFLKVATIAGAGVIVSQLSPKKAQAFIMGSSPTTGVVGVKDAANARINPATEETVSSLLKTSDLTFDTGSLQVKVTSVSGEGSSSFSDSGDVAKSGRVDDATRHVYVDVKDSVLPTAASTETTLQTISFGGFKFTLRLDTVGDIDYVGEAAIGSAIDDEAWRIKRIDSTSGIVIQWAGTGVFDTKWVDRVSPPGGYS